jgi:sensor domain CHASE-containing protein
MLITHLDHKSRHVQVQVLSSHRMGGQILQLHTENTHFLVCISCRPICPTDDGSIPAGGLIMLSSMLVLKRSATLCD